MLVAEFVEKKMKGRKGFFYGYWWKKYCFEPFPFSPLNYYTLTILKTWSGFSLEVKGISVLYPPRVFFFKTIENCVQQIKNIQGCYYLVPLVSLDFHQVFYHLLSWEEKLIAEDGEKQKKGN